ncbi:MerR family transcriptional regulator [Actinomadura sp. NBRC 104412]|uniref:MerR family transcriptional regulator n=1 Tax=Actinomadura sp. NBRC 104412 TaxID=3032203 RepID=UPI002554CACA|nr:MerR family transcriptional regulator [Actinomadura sp. NBRC 104412]
MDAPWTIAELAERAAAALSADGAEASGRRANGRVRDLPNERLIRWYTTIGLIDPPLGRRGRTALYGPRHLLQLVAVKRRQATGRSIAEIQVELAGATDATLSEIAGLRDLPAPARLEPEPGRERGRARFWAAQPSAPPPNEANGVRHTPEPVQGVRLAPGVTVLLDDLATTGHLSAEDLAAIGRAARPFLDELRRRGLLRDTASPDAHDRTAEPPGRSK